MHNKMNLPICTRQRFYRRYLADLIVLEWQIKVFNLFYDSSFWSQYSQVQSSVHLAQATETLN